MAHPEMSQKNPDDEKETVVHSDVATVGKQQHPYVYYLTQIIAFSQQLYGVDEDIEARLAEEIKAITNDQVHLYLHRQFVSPELPIMVALVTGRRGFLVRWGDVIYGSLQVSYVDGSNDRLAIPIDQCERLANDCGWCLHVLEMEKIRQYQNQQSSEDAQQKIATLSLSERQVLEFMVLGLSTRAIAEKLQVSKRTIETHQRHIYQMLDVHSQREAVLIGLAAGMNVNSSDDT
jgi:DNA-binding CsgD family transcriptional regulator